MLSITKLINFGFMNKLVVIFLFFSFLTSNVSARNRLIKISGYAQGTTYHISYYDHKKRNLQPEIELLLNRFNQSVSLYDSNSIICQINKNKEHVVADDYFTVCFNRAQEVAEATNGAFDVTVGPLVSYWGFGLKNKDKTDSAGVDSLLKFIGYRLVVLKDHQIIKKDKRLRLDFNALAQGYSVDLVAKLLESEGVTNYLIEIGGEVFAKGKKSNGEVWTVGIETPGNKPESDNPLMAIATLKNAALATSGNYRKFYEYRGKRYSHIINPHSGYPAMNSLLSVSVVAADCITADAYATAFMVMGLDESIRFLSQHPELQAYMIYTTTDNRYEIYQTSGLKDIIQKIP